MSDKRPVALEAATVPPRTKPSNYPQPFAALMNARVKRALGDAFGLRLLGVGKAQAPLPAVAQQAGMEEKALEFRKGREIYVPVNQVK